MITLKDMVGSYKRFGVSTTPRHPFHEDANGIALQLGDYSYFLFEDPADGFRSCAAPVLSCEARLGDFRPRSPLYVARKVSVSTEEDARILVIKDVETDHVFLRVGTDYSDHYYPRFICEWAALPPTNGEAP